MKNTVESKLKQILDDYPDTPFEIVDGLHKAVVEVCGERLVYSIDKVIEILMNDMSEDDAYEYFYNNIECAYMGEHTPIWVELY
jgi:hypothetical protein